MASCVLFVQMGLSGAIQEVLHINLRIASCPKCLSWWICLPYLLLRGYGIVISVAASFLLSYCALWLTLAYDLLATLYNKIYESITQATEDAETRAEADTEAEADADEVSEVQIKE